LGRVGYARVSTADQNADLQQAALKAAGCHRIFTDHGVSGSRASRPELDKMLDHLRDGDDVEV
jgi:DNA invertase Pin-like site-specific DNA recombinase